MSIFLNNYPLKSTFENAKVGISFDIQLRASSAEAMKSFHREMKFPVTSIPLTGRVIFPPLNRYPSIP